MQPWTSVGECRSTLVLPAVTHLEFMGRYRSAWGADFTSKVRMVPLDIRVQPSSALKSFLPVEARAVHVMVAGSSAAISLVSLLPRTNRPIGNTTEEESPIVVHPVGGATMVQVLALGS